MPRNIAIHAERREALVKADSRISLLTNLPKEGANTRRQRLFRSGEDEIRRANDPTVFFGSYASSVSTVDGISSYFGGKRRTIHLECLRHACIVLHGNVLWRWLGKGVKK